MTLTAARGRGKSAALGICIAAAVAYGYSNIFVTSPSPENLNTLFEFIFKGSTRMGHPVCVADLRCSPWAGLEALEYKRHLDFEAIESTNPDFNRAIVRVNLFRDHRQTIAYVLPQASINQ